jgi:hypothetical protein
MEKLGTVLDNKYGDYVETLFGVEIGDRDPQSMLRIKLRTGKENDDYLE